MDRNQDHSALYEKERFLRSITKRMKTLASPVNFFEKAKVCIGRIGAIDLFYLSTPPLCYVWIKDLVSENLIKMKDK